MSDRHLTDDEIIDSLGRDAPADVISHLETCATCRQSRQELREFTDLIAEMDDDDVAPDEDGRAYDHLLRRWILDDEEADRQASTLAELTFRKLRLLPQDEWRTFLGESGGATPHLARRLAEEAELLLDSDAREALELLKTGEFVLQLIPIETDDTLYSRAELARRRASALRMLGRLDEALEAANESRSFAERYSWGNFGYARATYARAAVYFKMGRFKEAKLDVADAAARFATDGDVRQVAYARLLEASILFDEGDFARAVEVFELVRDFLRADGDDATVARVTANIGVAHFRLKVYDEARRHLVEARAIYERWGMDSEVARSEWTMGAIDVAEGHVSRGMSRFRDAARAFENLHNLTDAGFVKLDVLELLVASKQWDEAERLARELLHLFRSAGCRAREAEALLNLRTAVAAQQARREDVEAVRLLLSTPTDTDGSNAEKVN